MTKITKIILLLLTLVSLFNCTKKEEIRKFKQPVYQDIVFMQDYAVKYIFEDTTLVPQKVITDRNGIIQVLASYKLFRTNNGHFQYPGNLVPDNNYVPMADMKITDLIDYQDQFVYLDDNAVLSNAWAGKLLSKHGMPLAKTHCGGDDFGFLVK